MSSNNGTKAIKKDHSLLNCFATAISDIAADREHLKYCRTNWEIKFVH